MRRESELIGIPKPHARLTRSGLWYVEGGGAWGAGMLCSHAYLAWLKHRIRLRVEELKNAQKSAPHS